MKVVQMTPTRRFFLKGSLTAALASKLFPIAFAQQLFESQVRASDTENSPAFDGVSRQDFERWIGSSFRLSLNNKQLGSMVLVAVKEIDNAGVVDNITASHMVGRVPRYLSGPSIDCFSLRFRKTGNALPQGTYTLDHDWLGTFPLFLVPSGAHGGRSTYTATFTILMQLN
jgi:hypothetical protein